LLFDLRKPADARPTTTTGMRLDRWNDRFFDPCAKLIYLCYTNHRRRRNQTINIAAAMAR